MRKYSARLLRSAFSRPISFLTGGHPFAAPARRTPFGFPARMLRASDPRHMRRVPSGDGFVRPLFRNNRLSYIFRLLVDNAARRESPIIVPARVLPPNDCASAVRHSAVRQSRKLPEKTKAPDGKYQILSVGGINAFAALLSVPVSP